MTVLSVRNLPLALIMTFAFASLVYVAKINFRGYPFSMDEFGYRYQAELMAEGKLSELAPWKPIDTHTVMVEGRRFSKYPPGFPLILAIGVWAGSADLVNPLIACSTLYVMFLLASSFVERRCALIAVALLASNTYFLGYGASFFAQPAALWATTCGMLAFERFVRLHSWRWLAIFGLLVSALMTIRPLDALCLLVPAALIIVRLRAGRPRVVALAACGMAAAAGALALCFYYYYLTGRPGLSAGDLSQGDFRLLSPRHDQPLWRQYLEQYWRTLLDNALPLLAREYYAYMGYALPTLAVVGAIRKGDGWRAFFVVHLVTTILLYNLHPTLGWPQYGARYFFPTLAPLVVFAALGWATIARALERVSGSGKTARWWTLAVALVVVIGQQVGHNLMLREYEQRFAFMLSYVDRMRKECPSNAILFLYPQLWARRSPPPFSNWWDLKRNSVRGDNLVVVSTTKEHDMVKAAFPERPTCDFRL